MAARLFGAILHLQANFGQLGAQEVERLCDILVRACDADVVAVAQISKDGMHAQAEQVGAKRVALCCPERDLRTRSFRPCPR